MPRKKKTSVQQRLCNYMKSHGIVVNRLNGLERFLTMEEIYNLINNPQNRNGSEVLRRLSPYGLTKILESDYHIMSRPRLDTTVPLLRASQPDTKEYSYVISHPRSKNKSPWDKRRFY